MIEIAYIALGSNVGDRRAHLDAALEALAHTPGIELAAVSAIRETLPIGAPGQGPYLNAVARVATSLSPDALLAACRGIEVERGRRREAERVRWGPRTLDLDILLFGERIIDEPGLTVPHPRLHERDFVLEPLAELAGGLAHPVLGATIEVLRVRLARDPGEGIIGIIRVGEGSAGSADIMTRTFSLNRALVTACLTACVAAGLCSRSARAQADEAFVPDPAAAKAFEDVVKAYLALPAVRVKSTLSIELSQGGTTSKGEEVVSTITWSRGGAGIVAIKGFTCWFKDGVVHAVHEKSADGYFRGEFEGSPYWELFSAFQDMPYPHLALLWGEEKMDEVWMQLELNSTPTIVPTQVSEVREGDRALERIVLAGTDGTLRIDVDPKTKLVHAMVHEVTAGPTVQAGAKRVTTYAIEHELFDAPLDASALAFVPGDRQRVDMLAALVPPPPAPEEPNPGEGEGGAGADDLAGKPAPTFVLATASGGAIDLEELRGKVVVLDFWATWCPPCRKGLPGLHDVARWARAEELPVEVLTVNTFEIGDPAKNTPDARLASVKAFWEKSGFTLPVAMDYTDETAAAYGVKGIPATFVIRADGVVHAVHGGSGPDDVAWLKARIGEAIEAVEVPADGPDDPDAPDDPDDPGDAPVDPVRAEPAPAAPAEGVGAPGAGS